MTTYLLGRNRFEECDTLIAHSARPLLRASLENGRLAVDLRTPPEAPRQLAIAQNGVEQGTAVVVADARQVSVIVDESLALHAVELPTGEILVDIDLRALGIAIYTDATGLHIGGSTLADNTVQGARTAVTLS